MAIAAHAAARVRASLSVKPMRIGPSIPLVVTSYFQSITNRGKGEALAKS
jgi:hypothetical protein